MSPNEHSEPWDRTEAADRAESRGRLTGLCQHLYGAVTHQMLAAAQIKPGDRVLDIAAGTGDQSRQAAILVGPKGTVLASDISAKMLQLNYN